MARVIAYHVVFTTHGFWLPNDPRGSGSTVVRYEPLRRFGPATPVTTRRSVAGQPHNRQLRRTAKQAMRYPQVVLTGHQALGIAHGFRAITTKCGYRIHACSILPQHVHMVIARHRYGIEQVVRLLRQGGTDRLLADGRHPFADQRASNGRLPSVWGQDFWKVFLFTPEEVRERIQYVDDNPVKEGKRRQRWPFVIPYEG
jgi:REP element-mobilizing transposase RayT